MVPQASSASLGQPLADIFCWDLDRGSPPSARGRQAAHAGAAAPPPPSLVPLVRLWSTGYVMRVRAASLVRRASARLWSTAVFCDASGTGIASREPRDANADPVGTRRGVIIFLGRLVAWTRLTRCIGCHLLSAASSTRRRRKKSATVVSVLDAPTPSFATLRRRGRRGRRDRLVSGAAAPPEQAHGAAHAVAAPRGGPARHGSRVGDVERFERSNGGAPGRRIDGRRSARLSCCVGDVAGLGASHAAARSQLRTR